MKLDKEESNPEWWKQHCPEDAIENIECSTKLIVLFSIIAECELIGDKLLVFSQSLAVLDLIEKYLEIVHMNTTKPEPNAKLGGFKGRWLKGTDYFRLDGNVKVDVRKNICDIFNDVAKPEARYTSLKIFLELII